MRTEVTNEMINKQIKELRRMIKYRLEQKGNLSFASSHELLGILTEEYHEFREAVHDCSHAREKIAKLMDLAVACIFGSACLFEGKMEW